MFGLEILDVALGLVLTYLLLSLILTSAREGLEGILKSRAVNLEKAVGELLQRDSKLVQKFYDHPLIFALHTGMKTDGSKTSSTRLSGMSRRRLPSYIPRETFTTTLLDLAHSGAIDNADMFKALDGLNRLSGGRVQQLRREVEGWYDGVMDRASGRYKRFTKAILFWAGLAVAVALNVNSITIAQHLATDEQSRFYVDRLAEQVVQKQSTQAAESNRISAASGGVAPPVTDGEEEEPPQFYSQLEQLHLPIGWDGAARAHARSALGSPLSAMTLLLGYLITALALMVGAPFWFDVLNRIMVIRSTVKPTEKSPDEPSEDGGKGTAGSAAPAGAPAPQTAVGGGLTVAALAPAMPVALDDPARDTDGCLDGASLRDDEVTNDTELPAAVGGVERG